MDFSSEFKEWLYDEISDALDDYKGVFVYGCDLAYKLFEGPNANGSVTCSYYDSKEFIRKYWDDSVEIFEEWKFNTGENLNPFEDPEHFHLLMLLEGSNDILSQSSFVNEHWDKEFEITDATIVMIKDDLGINTGLSSEEIQIIWEEYSKDPDVATLIAGKFLSSELNSSKYDKSTSLESEMKDAREISAEIAEGNLDTPMQTMRR